VTVRGAHGSLCMLRAAAKQIRPPDTPDAARTPADAAPNAARELIDHLKAENDYLRDQLDQRSRELAAERERFDVLHREALGRIPALGAGQDAPVAARAPQHGAQAIEPMGTPAAGTPSA
jgi:hypothetical protein